MIPLYFILVFPIFGIIIMACFGHLRIAGKLNMLFSAATFIASIFLVTTVYHHGSILTLHQQFYIDAFNILSIVLTTLIATTTAWFSIDYMWHQITTGKISRMRLRLYYAMYQVFTLTMLITLTTNNIGILWVAMEGATLATVLLVSLYRTPEAIEAAWKYFILCIVGIALALFGTILVYASASQLVLDNHLAILFTNLYKFASMLDVRIIKLAFVFLLVGYGTKIGLVPLHNWLPDAHSESPAPMSSLLSGLLLNVALYALIRFKILVDLTLTTNLAGNLMIGFGLLSFVFASIIMFRQKNIKRMFSYSSIEHMGLITFAFGLGSKLATFCALFYMLMHSLAKSAIFVTVGNVISLTGTQSMEKMRGLIKQQPIIGWTLLLGTIAVAGFPPFGIFTCEFMLFIATIKSFWWLIVFIFFGLIFAIAGLLHNIQPVVFGEPDSDLRIHASMFAPILHLALVFVLGIYIPPVLANLLHQATLIITKQL
jgi:hydrogenase-4 component F